MSRLTHLSLFTGIGGLDLAAEWAGFETAGQCEWANYPTKVLEKHWPDVPRWRNIRTLTGESFYERTGVRTVDVVSGGPPCQPHSIVGKRKGEADSRNMWDEYRRIVSEVRPTWAIIENVGGFLYTVHDAVCTDLEDMGYSTSAFSVPAYAVAAPHERYRVFIVAYANSKPELEANSSADRERTFADSWKHIMRRPWDCLPGAYWATHKSPVCGMDDGISGGMGRYIAQMTALGNAVVPQQAYPIFAAIAEWETGR